MAIKRLSKDELLERCTSIFYDYMSSNSTFYYEGKELECSEEYPTPADMVYKTYLDAMKENRDRFKMYSEALANGVEDPEYEKCLKEAVEYLGEEYEIFENMDMASQKKTYKETSSTEYAASAVRIPLSKLINSYYDDLTLEVLFYDDACTPAGKHDEYKKLKTSSERREFLLANTEITHMGLALIRNNGNDLARIILKGKFNYDDPRVQEGSLTLLESDFADFSTLNLAATNKIENNDLKQFFQERIDMDKENLKLLASKEVRGDVYKVFSLDDKNSRNDLYIRYVCPSTGRVYYNKLNVRNLQLSDYFKSNDYDSYIDSWWNITHMGAAVEGKAVVSC